MTGSFWFVRRVFYVYNAWVLIQNVFEKLFIISTDGNLFFRFCSRYYKKQVLNTT